MQHKKPIYLTRKDTCLAGDRIVPCGGKIGGPPSLEEKSLN